MRTYQTPAEAWVDVLRELVEDDEFTEIVTRRVAPRGQPTTELRGPVGFRIVNPAMMPLAVEGRTLRHAITAAEGLSLVGQTSVPEIVVDRIGAFRKFLKSSVFWGAYGPRVAGDVGNAVHLLNTDPDSRQAVLTLFDADRDLGRADQLDLPCTVAIQFLLRGGDLEMFVTMRSNDVWLGLPYDLGQFAMLQSAVAQSLGAGLGTYTHVAGSMHLYERDLEKAENVAHNPALEVHMPPTWGVEPGDETRPPEAVIGEIASR